MGQPASWFKLVTEFTRIYISSQAAFLESLSRAWEDTFQGVPDAPCRYPYAAFAGLSSYLRTFGQEASRFVRSKAANRESAAARFTALCRALEQFREPGERLFVDPYAIAFAWRDLGTWGGFSSRALTTWLDCTLPGILEFIAIRARASDEVVRSALQEGIDQITILGAGYDTTGLRLAPTTTVYEVDRPATQGVKRAVLTRLAPDALARIRLVALDFERDDLTTRLIAAGFQPSRPSLVTWLGTSYYLTAQTVEVTLSHLARLMAAGSIFLFDYLIPSAIDGTSRSRTARLALLYAKYSGEPYTFGLDPDGVAPLLQQHGMTLIDQATPDAMVRRSMKTTRRAIEYAYIATARRHVG